MTIRGIGIVLLCLAAAFLKAGPVYASQEGASAFIEKLGHDAIEVINNEKVDENARRDQLETLLRSNIDLRWIGKFVLGRYWRDASEAQRERFFQHYEAFVIKHYTQNFQEFVGTTYRVTKGREEKAGEYLLTMELRQKTEAPIIVGYRVREHDGGYRVFDVIVEGVSLIASQRSEFASAIERHGIDYLIDRLADKAQKLAAVK